MRCSRLLICLVLLPRAFAVSPQSSVQEQATELVRAGHLNQALEKLQKAAAYLKRGDDQTARNYFEKACAFNPKHTDAYYQWLRIAVQRGEKDKVAELSEIVRRLHDEEKNQIQETVTGVVEESLRASPEGILLTRSTN
jgi:Tfp pilus assembly protein PilF